jgi:hypothetical protein
LQREHGNYAKKSFGTRKHVNLALGGQDEIYIGNKEMKENFSTVDRNTDPLGVHL